MNKEHEKITDSFLDKMNIIKEQKKSLNKESIKLHKQIRKGLQQLEQIEQPTKEELDLMAFCRKSLSEPFE